MEMSDEEVSQKEVWDSLKSMDESDLVEPDVFYPAMAKQLRETPIKPFTQLFHASLGEGWLPAEWLRTTAIPVHKGGGRNNCGSYTLVTLTSILLKTTECPA